MKLSQAEVDTLSIHIPQLLEMRDTLKTFDLQIDEEYANKGFQNILQADLMLMHNTICSLVNVMQKHVNAAI